MSTGTNLAPKLTFSELLSAIFSVAVGSDQEIASNEESIWDRQQVGEAGQRFLTWTHEIRHRGTFSKLATAFAGLVQAVKRVPSLADLPMAWLEVSPEIFTIQGPKCMCAHSTERTRYSPGR